MTSGDVREPHPVLAGTRVADAMSHPIQACAPDLALPDVARLMAELGIHCVAVVEGPDAGAGGRFLGVLSDLDLVEAADADLALAARVMQESRTHHLVVVEPGTGRAVGVLSTLDVARVLAREDEAAG